MREIEIERIVSAEDENRRGRIGSVHILHKKRSLSDEFINECLQIVHLCRLTKGVKSVKIQV